VIGVLMATLMFCYKRTCQRLNHVVCEEMGESYSSEAEASAGQTVKNFQNFEEWKPAEEDTTSQVKLEEPLMNGLGNRDL